MHVLHVSGDKCPMSSEGSSEEIMLFDEKFIQIIPKMPLERSLNTQNEHIHKRTGSRKDVFCALPPARKGEELPCECQTRERRKTFLQPGYDTP